MLEDLAGDRPGQPVTGEHDGSHDGIGGAGTSVAVAAAAAAADASLR